MQTSRARTERLWKEYLRDPSQWWDNRNSKTSPREPDFKYKLTEESLWMDGRSNPSWVKDRLRLEETEERCAIVGMHKEQEGGEETKNSPGCGLRMLSLEETLLALEAGLLPQPSVEDFARILHNCRKERDRALGLRLHSYICKNGLEAHTSLGNYLVSMLVEVGCMNEAQQVFDRMVSRNNWSWNSLIAGYIKCGKLQHALTLYQQLQKDDFVHLTGHAFVALLKACAKLKDMERGLKIHAQAARMGLLERDLFVSSALVDMYAKCGWLAKAQQVFNKLPVKDVVLWTALIAGYAEHGHGKEALKRFEQMKLEGVSPNAVTFVCSLKACGSIAATDRGQEIHAEVERQGLLERDLVVGNTLVDMYAKCGLLAKSQQVFDRLPAQNVVTWNALIAGYAEHGHGEEALKCFEQMQLEGISPDAVTFVCSLKACGSIGAADKVREIDAEITRKGLLERDLVVGSTLVYTYAKCGLLAKAQQVFDKLPVRDVVSWTALIAGYAEHGHGEEALKCFEGMQFEGLSPDAATFVCSLKACGSIGATGRGLKIHAEIERKGLPERNLFASSTLVDMYAKCGLLAEAQQTFDKLPIQDVVSWNTLIAGYAKRGHPEEALKCFEQMQLEGVSPNAVTYVSSLKACGSIESRDKGLELHAEIDRKGLLERDHLVGSTLVDMYAKCGWLAKSQQVFDKLPVRDVVLWTTLITGYAENGYGEEALKYFEQMQFDCVSPNAVTFVCVLKACGSIGATDKGLEIHAEIERKGLLERDVVGSTLVDMYAKCGSLAQAQQVFDKLPVQDVVSWTALIAGYAEHGHGEEALKYFEQMQLKGVLPNVVTFVCSLKACGSIGATDMGQELHAEMERMRLLEIDHVVGSALVDMYAKCGWLAKAQQVFDKIPVRDVVLWTTLIAGYAEDGHAEEALKYFEQMQFECVSPNVVTFACILKACGSIGATDKGLEIHAEIERKGILVRDCIVGSTLVDMYSKCGSLAMAQQVFDKLPARDVVSWNALIAGYAQLGERESVFHFFDRMVGESIKPDPVTFVIVLNACSRIGSFNKSLRYFEAMQKDYGIIPTLEHHNCMVDLLGRSGKLDNAITMIKKMPFCPTPAVWHSVLGACGTWGNVEVGKQAFEHAVRLDEKDAAAYVLMSHIYAGADMQEEASKIEAMRVEKQAWKRPEHCWWTDDTAEIVHSFLLGNDKHSKIEFIPKLPIFP